MLVSLCTADQAAKLLDNTVSMFFVIEKVNVNMAISTALAVIL